MLRSGRYGFRSLAMMIPLVCRPSAQVSSRYFPGRNCRRYSGKNLSIRDISSDIAKGVEEEVRAKDSFLKFEKYLSEKDFLLDTDETAVTLTKSIGKHVVFVKFNPTSEGEEYDSEYESEYESEDNEEEDGVEEVSEEEDDINQEDILEVPIQIQISTLGSDQKTILKTLSLSGTAAYDRLYLDALYSANGAINIHFEELSENLQTKIYDYLEALSIDNDFSAFVNSYVNNYENVNYLNVLAHVKDYMSTV
eukprot:TRINITY_DN8931_c0_g1_i2.p1 TRINITY_DN8931_c0_g1~~TRINITY_DN8931_c0_g1_i2.p1  ORF type:complete len:251 (-),score=37.10 TRINITY_DN8931_c0_g1_i2:682-1434(-)